MIKLSESIIKIGDEIVISKLIDKVELKGEEHKTYGSDFYVVKEIRITFDKINIVVEEINIIK